MDTPIEPDEPSASLARDIERAAGGIAVGDPQEMLGAVHERVSRRKRRRNTFLGLAAAAVLLVSGVVIVQFVGGDSGDDLVVSAPVTEPSVTEPVDSAPVDAEPSVTEPVDSAPADSESRTVSSADDAVTEPSGGQGDASVAVAEPITVDVVSTVVDDLAGGVSAPDNQLFPWQGGVLAISTDRAPQPLPDRLPTEISEAFPPEVQELFPDGLPPTIEEATTILQEAGLLDEVIDVLNANPEVSDAVYAQPMPEPTRTVQFSTDGADWADIDAAIPHGADTWNGMTSTGERFVVVRPVSNGEVEVVSGPPEMEPDAFEIHSSTNLVDWTVQTIPVPESPATTDPAAARQMHIVSVAATDSGFVFVVNVMADRPFDIVEFLDPDLQERVRAGGFSYSQGDEGVTIGLSDPDDPNEIIETFTFTWAELGITEPPSNGVDHSTHRYTGRWDGTAPVVDFSRGWSEVHAIGEVFVETGPAARWSVDGVEWTPIDLPVDEVVEAVMETDAGVAVVTGGPTGRSTMFVGDLVTGGWRPVATPQLPGSAHVEQFGDGAVLLADYGDPVFADPYADAVGSRETAEVDGYRYEMESTWGAGGAGGGDSGVATYRLTELATGTVVVTETSEIGGFVEEQFEHLERRSDFGDGFRILDPETGEPLVTIRYPELTQEIINPDGSSTDLSTVDFPEPPTEPPVPEYWVVAFVSEAMIVEPIETGNEFEGGFPVSVVGFDDVVLIARSDGLITRFAGA